MRFNREVNVAKMSQLPGVVAKFEGTRPGSEQKFYMYEIVLGMKYNLVQKGFYKVLGVGEIFVSLSSEVTYFVYIFRHHHQQLLLLRQFS